MQFVLKNIFFRLGEIDIFAREGKYANLIALNYASLSISRKSKKLYLIFMILLSSSMISLCISGRCSGFYNKL